MKSYDALWIDDIRLPPDGWLWAKTSREAIDFLNDPNPDIRVIQFDHDLGLLPSG